jgi:hypothetical protein
VGRIRQRPGTESPGADKITGNSDRRHGTAVWRDLPVQPVAVPPERLSTPTLGAVMQAAGATMWCDEAKVIFAATVVQEAQRRILLERLNGICHFLAAGATPDQAITRLVRLVDEFYGRTARCVDCKEAA